MYTGMFNRLSGGQIAHWSLMNTFIRPSMGRQTDRQIYTDKNSTNIQVKMSITHIKP